MQAVYDRIGMGDQNVLISVMIQKLSNNLRYWADDSEVVSQTLELFVELTTFGNGKMLLSLEAVNYILTHHTVGNTMPLVACYFLCPPSERSNVVALSTLLHP